MIYQDKVIVAWVEFSVNVQVAQFFVGAFGMKQQNLAEISKMSGKSRSTVSKVLRGCGGVTAETREQILCSARSLEGGTSAVRQHDIFVILPDNPKYFWHRARSILRDCKHKIALRLFSAIKQGNGEADLVERYVEEAVTAGARVLILSVYVNARLQARLAELARRMLVIQLCEYMPIPNTFFVGSNGERDGEALARYVFADSERSVNIGIMTGASSHTGRTRVEGFLKHLPSNANLFYIEKPNVIELYASHLARRIDLLDVRLDYLFCFDGITTAACDALYKLRGKMDTKLIGFEIPPTAEKHMEAGRIAALAVQAPDQQMQLALKLAERYVASRVYPDQKYCYVSSEIITQGNASATMKNE